MTCFPRAGASTLAQLGHGASLARLRVPDRDGVLGDVILGFGSLADYQRAHPYLGSVVGRHANRIRNGRFILDGRPVELELNDGAHHLHGGPRGFNQQAWAASARTVGDAPAVEFALHSPDGDQGYPGALEARVVYSVRDGSTDQPGLQVYTGNFLDGSLCDRDGRALQRHAGLCLEAQRFPDGPNQPTFPDAILRPGQVYRQTTVLQFDTAGTVPSAL